MNLSKQECDLNVFKTSRCNFRNENYCQYPEKKNTLSFLHILGVLIFTFMFLSVVLIFVGINI